MPATTPIVLQLDMQQQQSLRESLSALKFFLEVFTPTEIQETVWRMLYEALSSEDAGGWRTSERNLTLFFYQQINMVSAHLVNIDKMMRDVVKEH